MTGVHNNTDSSSNQNQIWCITIGGYNFFGSNLGSDSYNISPPAIALSSWPRDFVLCWWRGVSGRCVFYARLTTTRKWFPIEPPRAHSFVLFWPAAFF